jgi:hypothetical protein
MSKLKMQLTIMKFSSVKNVKNCLETKATQILVIKITHSVVHVQCLSFFHVKIIAMLLAFHAFFVLPCLECMKKCAITLQFLAWEQDVLKLLSGKITAESARAQIANITCVISVQKFANIITSPAPPKKEMEKLLTGVPKKDEDAEFYRDSSGNLYISTTVDIPPPSGVLSIKLPDGDASILENAASSQLPDAQVVIVRNLFLANALVIFTWIVLSLPLYFWTFEKLAHYILLAVASFFMSAAYLLMALLRKKVPWQLLWVFFATWLVCMGLVIGSVAFLIGNIAPFQCLVILEVESFTVIIYTIVSNRFMDRTRALLYMSIAGILVWGVGIAGFFVDRDWIASIVVFVIAVACTVYYWYQMKKAEGRYNMSWEDFRMGVVQFYCDF